ncbi:MAG TPA: FtsQ-type POTRA domain-containing protein [Gemmatimonadaceae bacterium]|nr:FtsQ-type POTRA domain-containing protein [Gemmatimonadaceae bacterium]
MTRLLAILQALRWRLVGITAAVVVLLAAPWWGPHLLSHLSFFRVRSVEVSGIRYLAPDDVVKRLRLDSTSSVWADLGELERRVEMHPQVKSATVDRDLPGTLIVRVTENSPIAYVETSGGLRAVDKDGRFLPIDPTRIAIDLPVLAKADTVLLHLLANVRSVSPALFGEISDIRRTGGTDIALTLSTAQVRALASISAQRLADIIPVEADLARRKARVTELDLRFRDQVIARTQ